MTRDEYRKQYLRSPHWRETRERALERAGHRCQVCNSEQRLDVHHRTYERIGAEEPGDLTVLCRRCHDLFHGRKSKKTKKRGKQAPIKVRYVSTSDRERYEQMRTANAERQRKAKAERAQRRAEVDKRRRALAGTRDWRDERALPRKTP
jgi:hypothetical protein